MGRQAHYHFTVKGNQPTLQADIALLFQHRQAPDHVVVSLPDHGRIETRRIWCSTALNSHADFPHVGQVFLIEREVIHKKTKKQTLETALGVTSRPPEQAPPKRLIEINRGHWTIEADPGFCVELREPVVPMSREKPKWQKPRGESTDAEHWDGATCTSDEGW